MNNVRFLSFSEVLLIHQDQIRNYGGKQGLRDSHMLSSAISMPESTYSGQDLHETVFDKAAAYLFHICQDHPFFDGNKRAGLASALVFLDLNGIEIIDPKMELYDTVIGVTKGAFDKNYLSSALNRLANN